MTIAPFPHRYSVMLDNEQLVSEPRTPIEVGAPPQFGGFDDVWSPEDLLVAAALTCLKTTFDAYMRKEGIAILDWKGVGTGVLVKGKEGPVFESIDLDVEIVVDSGEEGRVQELLAKAERQCIISRALTAPVRVIGKIAKPARAA
jgi:organic hydroperoxide reductase OsmC/OhrA